VDDDGFPGYVAGRLAELPRGLLRDAAERSRALCAAAVQAATAA
jgi:hypothetical protein